MLLFPDNEDWSTACMAGKKMQGGTVRKGHANLPPELNVRLSEVANRRILDFHSKDGIAKTGAIVVADFLEAYEAIVKLPAVALRVLLELEDLLRRSK